MSADRMPALFLGHGNPMHALADNEVTRTWSALGATVPRPRAILVASAHWCTRGWAIGGAAEPATLHDFGGFPPELFQVRYPAPGDPVLAREIVARLGEATPPLAVRLDADRPLDHGIWCPLRHLFPAADLPVIPLSVDPTASPADHFALGRALRALRDEGILLVGSGNVVHNLSAYTWGRPDTPPAAWALEFETAIREALARGDDGPVLDPGSLGLPFRLSVPTAEHYLPLPVIRGACWPDEPAEVVLEGFEGGSLSMLSYRFGSGSDA